MICLIVVDLGCPGFRIKLFFTWHTKTTIKNLKTGRWAKRYPKKISKKTQQQIKPINFKV